ncbi:hypothetical protein FBU30_003151 [Linnemannia zychae]|nr:hypothetical protein FBU30_003151 [Linnemannia zychae]
MNNDVVDLRILHPEDSLKSVDSTVDSKDKKKALLSYAHRFYAELHEDGLTYGVKSPSSSKPPITINSKEKWSCLIPIGAIEPGYYWITLAISYQDPTPRSLKAFSVYGRIALTNIDSTEQCQAAGMILDDNQTNELGNRLSNGGILRVKLLQQLQFPNEAAKLYANILINFELEDEKAGGLDLHYIEFHNRIPGYSDNVEDFLLVGESKPDKIISVVHSDDSDSARPTLKACVIHSYAISASGSHVATLSFSNRYAYLDLWDLSSLNFCTPKDGNSQQFSVPYASVSFRLIGTRDESCSYFVGITGSGSMISLCPYQNKAYSLPFNVYRCAPIIECESNHAVPLSLERIESHQMLQGHFGYGVFHCIDIRSPTEENDRFVACNGPSVQVFSVTSGIWELQNTISVRLDRTLEETLSFLSSMRFHYFIWPGAMDELTFWDVESGTQRSGLNLPDQNPEGVEVSIALDSTTTLLTRPQKVTIYAAQNNTIIGSYIPERGTRILGSYLAQDHVIVNIKPLLSDNISRHCTLKILSFHENMAEEFTWSIYQEYKIICLPRSKDLIMGYSRGSILNLIQQENVIPMRPEQEEHSCSLQTIQLSEVSLDTIYQQTLDTGSSIELAYISHLTDAGFRSILQISVIFDQESRARSSIRIGPNTRVRKFSILQDPPQLLLFSLDGIQVWNLPLTESDNFELTVSLMFVFGRGDEDRYFHTWFVTGAEACMACRRLNVNYIPYMKDHQEKPSRSTNDFFDGKGLFIPRSSEFTVKEILESPDYIEDAMLGAVQAYMSGHGPLGEAVIRHLKAFIKPSIKIATVCMASLCRRWPADEMDQLCDIMKELLTQEKVSWAPMQRLPDLLNPLTGLLQRAKTAPDAVDVIKIMIDYCSHHAYSETDFDFLSPVFNCQKDLMKQYPELAFQTLARMAYVESGNRSYYVHNHAIAYPPSFKRLLLRRAPPIYKLDKDANPVLQYRPNPSQPDPKNSFFTKQLYQATFRSLWHYHVDPSEYESGVQPIGWVRTAFEVIKLRLLFKTKLFVECHDFSIRDFDNPSIHALVAYKWNTIGFPYWLARFFLQCIFYSLVLVVAVMQVYSHNSHAIEILLVGIITLGAIFLYLELGQAVYNWLKHKYNLLDLLAFGFPLGASVHQRYLIRSNSISNTQPMWPISFSVLIVFLHLLSELRINKSIGKFVTIIQQAIVEIKVFFMIFAAVVFIFGLSLVHLIHSCPAGTCTKDTPTDFPREYLRAVVSTFFFMGGRFDPVQADFDAPEGNAAFHLMMVLFQFFSVILLLNVLIALINVAFAKGDDGWKLAWVENRLRYIESAENLSYNIPGYRTRSSFFPKTIFYSGTLQQAKEYRKRCDQELTS